MDKLAIEELLEAVSFFVVLAQSTGYAKVWGPYNRSSNPQDKRKIVIVLDQGKKRTMSYPKFLYEQATGIKLKPNESIDHKDLDIDNNQMDNLCVIDRVEHSKLDTRRVKPVDFKCDECGTTFGRLARHTRDKARKGTRGIFCGRVCAGKNARKRQLGLIEAPPIQPMTPSIYFKNKTLAEVSRELMMKYSMEMNDGADRNNDF